MCHADSFPRGVCALVRPRVSCKADLILVMPRGDEVGLLRTSRFLRATPRHSS